MRRRCWDCWLWLGVQLTRSCVTRVQIRVGRPKRTVTYLVDPASSHMLVSKIKPCMSKYKHLVL